MVLFISLFIKYLLSAFYVPGIIPRAGDIVVNKT